MNVQAGRVAESRVGRLVMLAASTPTISARVSELKQRIALGNYTVPVEMVAKKLMECMLGR